MLEENGIMPQLLENKRPSKDKYEAEAHKNYDYTLYVKHHSTFKNSCQKSSYKVSKFVALVDKSESFLDAFGTIMII